MSVTVVRIIFILTGNVLTLGIESFNIPRSETKNIYFSIAKKIFFAILSN